MIYLSLPQNVNFPPPPTLRKLFMPLMSNPPIFSCILFFLILEFTFWKFNVKYAVTVQSFRCTDSIAFCSRSRIICQSVSPSADFHEINI